MFDINIGELFGAVRRLCGSLTKMTDEKMVKLCRKNDLKRVKQALENGGNVNAWSEKGRTLIIEASKNGNLELVNMLIRFNADVNANDDKGITALMEASRWGHRDIVEALIRAGANVNAATHKGWTALMQAVQFGHPHTASTLLNNGADPRMKNRKGQKAINLLPKKKSVFQDTRALEILKAAEETQTLRHARTANPFEAEHDIFVKVFNSFWR